MLRAALRLEVPLDHVDVLDAHAPRVTVAHDLEDLAGLALVFFAASDDLDGVTLLDAVLHKTSGASDTIFMNFLARSSRATGPKMRVPIGSLSLLINTAPLLSKRM